MNLDLSTDEMGGSVKNQKQNPESAETARYVLVLVRRPERVKSVLDLIEDFCRAGNDTI